MTNDSRLATAYYNNESILKVGKKYHGCKFEQVPAWYFLWLLEQGAFADLYLKEWIEKNKEILEQEKKEDKQRQPDYDRYERQRLIRKQFGGKRMTSREGDII